jgi:hypothetical protein
LLRFKARRIGAWFWLRPDFGYCIHQLLLCDNIDCIEFRVREDQRLYLFVLLAAQVTDA